MIKTFIKHFIYEACIDQFFDGISKNFMKFNPHKIKTGKLYSKIHYQLSDVPCNYVTNGIFQRIYIDAEGNKRTDFGGTNMRGMNANFHIPYNCVFNVEE